jgi:GAF domain-containing protein/HAMP domain-containing protein
MSTITGSNAVIDTRTRYQGRLRNTFLIALLPVSILLILLMGGITYLRARNVIQGQVNSQLNANLESLAVNLDQWINKKTIRMDLAVRRPPFQEAIGVIINNFESGNEDFLASREILLNELNDIKRSGEELLFNNYFVTLPDGLIITSTQPDWEMVNINNSSFFQQMTGASVSRVVNNPTPLINNDFVVLTSVPYYDSQDSLKATIFGISGSLSMIGFLEDALLFNPAAQGYFLTEAEEFIWIDPYQLVLTKQTPSAEQLSQFIPLKNEFIYGISETQYQIVSLDTFDGTPVISNYTWLPSFNSGLIIELPEEIAFGELNSLGPFTIIVALILGILVAGVILAVTQRLVGPLQGLTETTQQFSQGNWDQRAEDARNDEIGLLSHTFNIMAEDLSELYTSLESQVRERTISLEKRSQLLEASAEVSQRAATVLEPEVLIQQSVELIREQFNLYYVGLFLVDDNFEWAFLRAGTGDAGRVMLDNNHRIKIGEGMIGWSILNAQTRIALDVGEDAVRFDNPHLPDTRSEGALPLRSRGRVIGAITVQSSEAEAFDEDTIRVFQTMADQIASALDNTQLLVRTQTALDSERLAYGEFSQKAWKELLDTQTDLGVIATSTQGFKKLDNEWPKEMLEVGIRGKIVRIDKHTVALPVILRDQVLGVVRLRKNEDESEWTNSEIELMESLVDQFEAALESARLYSDTQRRAARARLVSDITTKIRSSTDPQEMLQTAVKELRDAVEAQKVQVLIQSNDNDQPS